MPTATRNTSTSPRGLRGSGNGPSRFWGVAGLKKITASVEIDLSDYNRARRIVRRWSRSQAALFRPHRPSPGRHRSENREVLGPSRGLADRPSGQRSGELGGELRAVVRQREPAVQAALCAELPPTANSPEPAVART